MGEPDLLTVSSVARGGIAEKIGVEKGDGLVRINNNPVSDIIDYYLLTSDDTLLLEIRKPSGEIRELHLKKKGFQNLGITFEEDIPGGIRHCGNQCLFCFVEQLPAGLRDTLYIKDDDYRHSFLYGNYISLTNLTRADWERILRMRLSPLYISVHTTSPRLRSKMFGNPVAGKIMEQLQRLSNAGITMHTQVVVCPGINDGGVLDVTLHDLASLWPEVASVSVVPVGITKFRKNDHPIFPVDRSAAVDLINRVERIQEECQRTFGYNFVFGADELYLKAGMDIPGAAYYEDFPQLENGVGAVRLFLDDMADLVEELPSRVTPPRRPLIITGTSAKEILNEAVEKLNLTVEGLEADVLPVENRFFGPSVTVAGLLAGQDIVEALKQALSGGLKTEKQVILPSVVLKADEEIFLDGVTVEVVEKMTGTNLTIVENSAKGLVQGALGMEVL